MLSFQHDFNDTRIKRIPDTGSHFSRHPLDVLFFDGRSHERHPLDYSACPPAPANLNEGNLRNGDPDSLDTSEEIYDEIEPYQSVQIDNRPPCPLPNDQGRTVATQDPDDFRMIRNYEKHDSVKIDDDMEPSVPNDEVMDVDVDIDFEMYESTLDGNEDFVIGERNQYQGEQCDRFSYDDQDELTNYENVRTVKLDSTPKLQVSESCESGENDSDDKSLSTTDRNKSVDFQDKGEPETQSMHLQFEKDTKRNEPSVQQGERPNKTRKPPLPAPRGQKLESDKPPKPSLTSTCTTLPTKQREASNKETPKASANNESGMTKTSRTKRGYENVYDYVVGNQLIFCVKGSQSINESPQRRDTGLAERIIANRCLIESNVRVRHILGHLTFLEDTEEVQLKEKESHKQATILLLDKICESTEEGKWVTFMAALEKEGYSYVVNVIQGESKIDEHEMVARKKLLQVFLPRLTEDLFPEKVIDHLYEKHVISSDDMDEIQKETTYKGRKAATYILLDRIPLRSPNWYSEFLQALRASSQGFLADEMEDTKSQSTLSQTETQENRREITYQKYITPGYNTVADIQKDCTNTCKGTSEDIGLQKQLTELQEKLKTKREQIDILKQIKTVKLDLDSAQEEEDALLKDIRRERNSVCDNEDNVKTVNAKETINSMQKSETVETNMKVCKDELDLLVEQSDPTVALTVKGMKTTIRFDELSCPVLGLNELYTQPQQQQLIKIYDSSGMNSPVPKPHSKYISVDSGVFSATLGDIDMLS